MDFTDVIPEEDFEGYKKGQHGHLMGFGKKPCLMVIDLIYSFVDPSFAQASGDLGWQTVRNVKLLLEKAREKRVPIIYSTVISETDNPADWGVSRKRSMVKKLRGGRGGKASQIVDEIAPRAGDVVIPKPKASVFFGTNLLGTLQYHQIDTLLITGATTSGCVRATVVDAASYNYFVAIPEECVADRARVPHKVNLFDMHMKYADVIPMKEVLKYLETI